MLPFAAFGRKGVREAGATLEQRVKKADNRGTAFADPVWKPIVLIEMKQRGEDLSRHCRQAFDYWTRLVPGRPRYAVLCNFDEFWVYGFETQMDLLGGLFERSMDQSERHAFGAHYTSPVDIMKIVGPTLVEPWRNEIEHATSLSHFRNSVRCSERPGPSATRGVAGVGRTSGETGTGHSVCHRTRQAALLVGVTDAGRNQPPLRCDSQPFPATVKEMRVDLPWWALLPWRDQPLYSYTRVRQTTA